MFLSDVFSYLALGELSQYAVGTNDSDSIAAEDYPKLISHINLGLTQLHTLLPLRVEQVTVQTHPMQQNYVLASANAKSTRQDGYILDSAAEPFKDNILVIEEVINQAGVPLPLNKSEEPESVFTPQFNKLQIPNPSFEMMAVMYRASHPKIALSQRLDPTQIPIEIPMHTLEALLSFVKGRIFSSQGSAEGVQEASLKMQNFYTEIEKIKATGLVNQDEWYTNNFRKNGWV